MIKSLYTGNFFSTQVKRTKERRIVNEIFKPVIRPDAGTFSVDYSIKFINFISQSLDRVLPYFVKITVAGNDDWGQGRGSTFRWLAK